MNYVESVNYEQFLNDGKTQDAVVRNLEIIGKASKSVSEELKSKYSQLAWSDLAKVRDKLIHHNFGVNWGIIDESLEVIKDQLEQILKDYQTGG